MIYIQQPTKLHYILYVYIAPPIIRIGLFILIDSHFSTLKEHIQTNHLKAIKIIGKHLNYETICQRTYHNFRRKKNIVF